MPGVLPWSYSSLNAFEQCPKRYHLTRITKEVVEPQTEATMWGNAVHKALENAVNGVPLPQRFLTYQPVVDKIRAAPGVKKTEHKFGLTASFQPTTFFAKDVWFRGVIDLTITQPEKRTAVVLDHKTGKVKEDGDQLKLFAATSFALEPWLENVKTGYLWLAADKITTASFARKDVPVIWQEFAPRIQRMVKAQELNLWPPRPSGLCKAWCPLTKRQCEFSGKE